MNPSLHPGESSIMTNLGLVLALIVVMTLGGYAAEAQSSSSNSYKIQGGPASPHPTLSSGIVGLALHLTAKRVGDPARLVIRAVHPSGPAGRAGITHGEEIYAVDEHAIVGKTYQEVVGLIRGEIGSSVKLSLRGPQGEHTVTLVRVNENILMEQTPQNM